MKRIVFIILALAVLCIGASAPVLSTGRIQTLKDAQYNIDTIPVPLNTEDTAIVTGYANLTILADISGSAGWNVIPYYSVDTGTAYHAGTLVSITEDTAWTVDTLGVDIMTIGVANQSGPAKTSQTITINIIPYNE